MGYGDVLRCYSSWNGASEMLGDCLTESWSDLGLTTERAEGTCLLPSCAWGCSRTFEKCFPPCQCTMPGTQRFWFRRTDLSHLAFSHKLSSCGSPKPYIPQHSPLTHTISASHFLLLFSGVIFVCKTTILLSLLLSYLMRNFSGLQWLSHQIPAGPLSFLGGKERAESLTCWAGRVWFLPVNFLMKLSQ